MGAKEVLSTLRSSTAEFKKLKPWEVHLNSLTQQELALVTYKLVQRSGYTLCKSVRSSESMDLSTMQFVVRQTHDKTIIQERNAYLAEDMFQRAISRKNDRTEDSGLLLTTADFGVEMESEEQITLRRDAIDYEVANMTGWDVSEGPARPQFHASALAARALNPTGTAGSWYRCARST